LLISTTKSPLNDKNFRRAIAAAVSYDDIRELAVSKYAPELKPGLIMDQGLEKKFFNSDDAAEFGVTFDPEKAKKILADAGYKSIFKADGTLDHMLDKNNERLPTLYIKLPAGWSDWEAIVKIAEKGLRAVGIDVREQPVEGSRYWSELPAGDFDLIMHKPAGAVTPSLPWKRLDEIMSSRNWQPVGGGSNMYENQGRYNNPNSPDYRPGVDSLLGLIPLLEEETEIAAAYRELNKVFMQDQPAVPLCYMPEQFYEFSTKHWKNWPTAANPYAPPLMPWVGASTSILWHLESAK
jgi:peptide/nickel transport system substrate-binding protein